MIQEVDNRYILTLPSYLKTHVICLLMPNGLFFIIVFQALVNLEAVLSRLLRLMLESTVVSMTKLNHIAI